MAWRVTSASRIRGFSLVELMIVLVIAGILASLAWPAYTDHVRRSWRAEAQTGLLELAQALEKHRRRTMSYTGTWQGASLPAPPKASVYASGTVPLDGNGTTRYVLRIQQANASGYEIRAIPVGDQARDACGTLILDHTGFRQSTSGSNCW
ncbi:MAG: type IV pilin protein [Gammaproteobacteria bacterium]|nr:MAG: type IV pilin protein [Gammaproteobacteria bacterium]